MIFEGTLHALLCAHGLELISVQIVTCVSPIHCERFITCKLHLDAGIWSVLDEVIVAQVCYCDDDHLEVQPLISSLLPV